jgi:hypothetical protein
MQCVDENGLVGMLSIRSGVRNPSSVPTSQNGSVSPPALNRSRQKREFEASRMRNR